MPTRLRQSNFGFIPLFVWTNNSLKTEPKIIVANYSSVEALPNTKTADVIGTQLLRSATSVSANYRAACCSKSIADVLHKLAIVEEEADESLYWLDRLIIESKIMPEAGIVELKNEMNEIVSMIVASIKTLRSKQIQILKSKIQN